MLAALPPDIIAFLAVILRGLQLSAQSVVLGGLLFLFGFSRPLAGQLAGIGPELEATGLRWTARAGFVLAAVVVVAVVANLAQLVAGLEIPPSEAVGADFVGWNLVMAAAALVVGLVARSARSGAPLLLLVAAALVILLASVLSSHAYARLDDRPFFMLADTLHQAGASLWIGGIPFMLLALARIREGETRRMAGRRFSLLFTGAVGLLLAGAAMLAWGYIATLAALIGTAYGIMTGAKITLLAVLLLLAFMNRRSTHAEGKDSGLFRLRRFAEVEIGIGVTVLMIAASMASQPPAVDQTAFQATVSEIHDRMAPVRPPRLVSPPSEALSIAADSKTEDMELADKMWSEFNHNWAGAFVLAMGLLAMAQGQRQGALGAALAAAVPGDRHRHPDPLGPGKLAHRPTWLLRDPDRPGSVPAPAGGVADVPVRPVRMGGPHRPAEDRALGPDLSRPVRRRRGAAAGAQPHPDRRQGALPDRVQPYPHGHLRGPGRLDALAGDPQRRPGEAGRRHRLADLLLHGRAAASVLPRDLRPCATAPESCCWGWRRRR